MITTAITLSYAKPSIVAIPSTLDAYKILVSKALFQVKGSDPTHMIAAAVNTLAECFEEKVQPIDAARCILDDAMTGQVW